MYDNFMKLITERYSVREFTDKVIDQETIIKILAAAQHGESKTLEEMVSYNQI